MSEQADKINILDFLNLNVETLPDVYESGMAKLKLAFEVPTNSKELTQIFELFTKYFDARDSIRAPNPKVISDAAKRMPHFQSTVDFYI
jgi:hypothetical protein